MIIRYDPLAIRYISLNIQKIGEFSLLKIIAWTRHKLPEVIKNSWHKIKVPFQKRAGDDIGKKLSFLICCCCSPFILLMFGFLAILVSVGFLGLVIKVKQVSFVGEIEVLDWTTTHWIQFLAFLNNMLALDLSKSQSINSILNFLFGGDDAKQDINELRAQEIFLNMLSAYSILNHGLLKTIIVLPQIGPSELQQLCIEETECGQRPSLQKRCSNRWKRV